MRQWSDEIDKAVSAGEISKAEDLCNHLLSRVGSRGDEALQAREKLAQIKLRGGDYKQARQMFEEMIAISTDLGDRARAGRCYLSLGTAHLRMGDYHLAEEHYRAAWHVFRWDVDDKRWLARCYANLGILFKARGNWKEALRVFSLGASVSSEAGDDANTCVILLGKCILMRKLGMVNSAWEICTDGRNLARSINCRPAICVYSLESANLSILRGDIRAAKDYLAEAKSLADQDGYRREQVIAAEVEGDLAYAEGSLAGAGEAYRRALVLAGVLADRSDLIAEVTRRIALVERELGRIEASSSYASRAVDVAREIGDGWELGVALRIMGEIHLAKRELGLAIVALEESISVLKELFADNYELGISEHKLGQVLLKRGGVGDLSRSRDHLLRARQSFGCLGWGNEVDEVDALLAQMEKDHGLFVESTRRLGSRDLEEVAGKYGVDTSNYGLITCDERIVGDIARWANTSVRLLIEGETGVGKELVARTLHAMSDRREGPFVPVDCGSLTETLAGSELFGHAKGAFTGAIDARAGLIEGANRGTLFLDEVGELGEALQVKLLRVLEEGTVRRIGENRRCPVDLRIMSATTRDLWQEVETGNFRRELYYRLKGVLIRVPALRERRPDIELLLEYYLGVYGRKYGKDIELSPAAKMLLLDYDWPGNVRELRNVMEAIVLSGRNGAAVGPGSAKSFLEDSSLATGLHGRVEELEQQEIRRALDACGGNKTKAAHMLGISRRTLYSKMGWFTSK